MTEVFSRRMPLVSTMEEKAAGVWYSVFSTLKTEDRRFGWEQSSAR